MNISFVVGGLEFSGGLRAILTFSSHLAARGHQVAIVAPRSASHLSQRPDPRVRLIHPSVTLRPRPNRPLSNLALALALARAVPRADVIVATHTPTAMPVLLAAAIGRGAPVWLFADYREMFVHRPIEAAIMRIVPICFRRILTYSRSSFDELPRATRAAGVVIGLGLSTREFLHPPAASETREPFLLYVGDARPRKGLTDFLSAAEIASRAAPGLEVCVVTKDNAPISTLAPLRHVIQPSDTELADLYRRCQVFVSTSWAEGLGLPPLEAMACGAPVVMVDQRGARDYALNEVNCLVVPPRDPRSVATAIGRILTDPALSIRLSSAGPSTADRYEWSGAVDRFESAVRDVLRKTQ